ncbi:MAG TPA: efflux RND transporter periplasmic adaptor subunit [Verrucomicrobiae bacterium]|jgi:HlyD family secretion protein|nr:efflux RND transporter periplasmic adaptor subunit [Verrucomicrobiae bacterium]
MQKALRATISIIVVVAGVGGVALWRSRAAHVHQADFREAEVRRGDLVLTIAATGTVEPEETVDVGAQVAGRVDSFGKDKNGKAIDYGSIVDEGMVLAKIDDSLYAADVALAKAQVDQDKAGVGRAQADLEQQKAKLAQAEADWNRAQKLGPSEALAPTAYDSYQANDAIAKANVALSQASLEQAKAAAVQAQATLDRQLQTLGYCTIISPVKGVIIDRRVNIGQTVVSSLNAPSLFLIAKDLTRMQVWVSVNEADIGSIHPGQPVSFTCDAFPNDEFQGTVGKVRLNATMTQNVVTYTVEVNTDNSSGRLLPYLTATARFLTDERHNVRLVPNAALRWRPPPDVIDPAVRETMATNTARSHGGAGRKGTTTGTVWVEDGEFAKPIQVTVGLTDGTESEIESADLPESARVIVGQHVESMAASDPDSNPFAPKNPFRRRRPASTTRTNAP